jgi:hypothetical protein
MWIRIRAVIIEDEPLAAQYLAELLNETCQVELVNGNDPAWADWYSGRLSFIRIRKPRLTDRPRSVRAQPGWSAILAMHEFAALRRRCSSEAKKRSNETGVANALRL